MNQIQNLQTIFRRSLRISKPGSPLHHSNWGKAYDLCVPEVYQLENLSAPESLRLRQDLQAVLHRGSWISKFVHPRITRAQAWLTFYFSHKLINEQICPPPQNSDCSKTYFLFYTQAHDLAKLSTSA